MKPSVNTTLILFITILVTACNGRSGFRQRLESLDSVLTSNPDSVYHLLSDLAEEADEQPHADRMYYELLRADAQNKAYIDFTTDSVMQEVTEYYDRHGNANERMRAHYLLGCTYRDLRDVPTELQCFQDAVEKADTTQKDCDLYTLAAIYGQMAEIYHDQLLPQEELKAIDKFEEISWKDKDTLSALLGHELHFAPYILTNQKDSIIAVLNRAVNLYKKYGYTEKAYRASFSIISCKIDEKRYDGVKTLLEEYERYSNLFDKENNIEPGRELFYYYKGKYLQDCENKTSEAILYYNKALAGKCYTHGYKGLISAYQSLGKPDSVAKYCLLYATCRDSVYDNLVTTNVEKITRIYDYTNQKRIAEKSKKKSEELEKLLLSGIIAILILSTIIFTLLVIYKKRKEKKVTAITIAYINTIKNKEALIKEIESQNSTLIEEHKTQKDSQRKLEKELAEKKSLLHTLQQHIDFYKNELKGGDHSNMLIAFKDTEIYRKLELCKHYRNGSALLTDNDWKRLYELFNQYFPKYNSFIMDHETLTTDETKTCILIRLGFRATDIGHILGKQKNQITNIRTSINKKIFANTGASTLDKNLSCYF